VESSMYEISGQSRELRPRYSEKSTLFSK